MAKFIKIALLIAFAAICCANPARLRNRQSKFLARQEVAESIPAQTPYPPSGIVPQVHFKLPTEDVAVEPDNKYLPPDNAPIGTQAKTYGPPEAAKPEPVDPKAAVDDDAITEEPEEAETEQPEDSDQPEVQDPLNDEAEDNEIETDPEDEELLLVVPLTPRPRTARLRARPLVPLRAQRVVAPPIPYRSQRLIGQQLYFADGRFFAYTPQYV